MTDDKWLQQIIQNHEDTIVRIEKKIDHLSETITGNISNAIGALPCPMQAKRIRSLELWRAGIMGCAFLLGLLGSVLARAFWP